MPRSPLTLLVCALGICISYLYYGMLQEQLFANARIGASFLLVTQCVTNTLVALIWQRTSDVLTKNKTPTKPRRLHHPLLILSTLLLLCLLCLDCMLLCINVNTLPWASQLTIFCVFYIFLLASCILLCCSHDSIQ